jgi:hypothetical protein
MALAHASTGAHTRKHRYIQIQWIDKRIRNDGSCCTSNGVTPWRQYLDFGLSSHSEDIAGSR